MIWGNRGQSKNSHGVLALAGAEMLHLSALIVRPVRNDVANTPTRILYVTLVARQDDHVQVINASSRLSTIVVADRVGIRLPPQERQLQDRFNVILGAVFQVIPTEHLLIEAFMVVSSITRLTPLIASK